MRLTATFKRNMRPLTLLLWSSPPEPIKLVDGQVVTLSDAHLLPDGAWLASTTANELAARALGLQQGGVVVVTVGGLSAWANHGAIRRKPAGGES